ncbi:MAG: ABC transporter substrate-binding protein [Planctomycetes bacterium]|nr:ABC transporter substrate-binding protein [Planctomycetota bacterium]
MHESSRPPWLGRRISAYARLPLHLFAAALALACQGGEPDGLAGAGSGDPAPGRSAVIPERVVSLAPNLTEIVYALGEQDRLVGVTRYCKFPPEAQEKPKVGALVNMNYERLLELEPDLVLVLPGHADVVNELDRLAIDSVTIRTETIADIYAAIEKIGEVFEAEHIAGRLIADVADQPVAKGDAGKHREIALGDAEGEVGAVRIAPLDKSIAAPQNQPGGGAARPHRAEDFIPRRRLELAVADLLGEVARPGNLMGLGESRGLGEAVLHPFSRRYR